MTTTRFYLNCDTGQNVQVGGGRARSDLHVAGNIFADGGLRFATKFASRP